MGNWDASTGLSRTWNQVSGMAESVGDTAQQVFTGENMSAAWDWTKGVASEAFNGAAHAGQMGWDFMSSGNPWAVGMGTLAAFMLASTLGMKLKMFDVGGNDLKGSLGRFALRGTFAVAVAGAAAAALNGFGEEPVQTKEPYASASEHPALQQSEEPAPNNNGGLQIVPG